MSGSIPLPTEEQQARAKWDLLLADLELRAEQIRTLRAPTPAPLTRVGWWQAFAVAVGAVVASLAYFTAGFFGLLKLFGVIP